jgi:hypothetical protein
MKLKIESVKGFYEFVRSIKSIAPGAIFIVSEKGCVVKSINESKSIRAFFRTNVVKAIIEKDDESVARLPILDLSKLLQSVKMVIETNPEDSAIFNVTKQFLTYNSKAKFKLKLFNEAHLVFHTTEDLKSKSTDMFVVDLTNDLFRYVMKYKGITGDKDPKIYIYTKDGSVLAEHDDKTQNLIDSLGIEISDVYDGELRNPICININNSFSKFNPLGAESIQIALQELNGKPAFLKVRSNVKDDSYITAVELVSKILEK